VDVTWKEGKLLDARIKSIQGGRKTVTIRYGNLTRDIEVKPGAEVLLGPDLRRPNK
jgi:hypothetical protein